jgi:phosphate transport system substrate-binding protein
MLSTIEGRYIAAAGAALLFTLSGCSTPEGGSTATTAGASPSVAGSPAGGSALNGAGATFPAPLYQRWFQEYGQSHNVQINYQPLGSGAGIKAITSKSTDFGASDAPMSDEELKAAPDVIHIPTVAGAVALAYNLPGAKSGLNLAGDVIADVFMGKITAWNDPRIAKLNPGVALPATKIAPIHRSDGSGTTNAFTTYLSEVSPEWKSKVGAGKSVHWSIGLGGKGTTGVAALIKQSEGSIGYVELNYAIANKIPYASVKNAAGKFVAPSLESTTAAAAGVTLPDDFRKVIVNTSAPTGYPITSFTFLLVRPGGKPELKNFLKWALTDGQKDAPALYYAPLPENVQKQALAAVEKIR